MFPLERRILFAAALLLSAAMLAKPGAALESKAREALLIDADTGAVLLEKNADQPMPPASMSKIMTVYLAMESLRDGRLSLDDELLVSEKAWRMGGSKMFVEVGKKVRVEDLLRGVVVQSGNDASIVLAEAIGGSEAGFAELMNQKARELGMTESSFANATGWPHPDQRMSARDLAILSLRTIRDFPEYYHYYAETQFKYGGIKQGNRNPLLYRDMGADGLKTGHTEEAGYGLAASAIRDGRRLVLVLNGLSSIKQRAEESSRLISWGFRNFANFDLFSAGDTVEDAPLWMGEAETLPLVVEADVRVTIPRKGRKKMTVTVKYDSPIPAPVTEGQQVASLVVSAPGAEAVQVPLLAGATVERLGPMGRLVSGLKHMVFGGP